MTCCRCWDSFPSPPSLSCSLAFSRFLSSSLPSAGPAGPQSSADSDSESLPSPASPPASASASASAGSWKAGADEGSAGEEDADALLARDLGSPTSPFCDACRTVVEEFYDAWVFYMGYASNKDQVEQKAGGSQAPAVTYDEETDSMVQARAHLAHLPRVLFSPPLPFCLPGFARAPRLQPKAPGCGAMHSFTKRPPPTLIGDSPFFPSVFFSFPGPSLADLLPQ